jgi:hypothetical protein
MECLVEVGWNGDGEDARGAVVPAEPELAPSGRSHSVDLGEVGWGYVWCR